MDTNEGRASTAAVGLRRGLEVEITLWKGSTSVATVRRFLKVRKASRRVQHGDKNALASKSVGTTGDGSNVVIRVRRRQRVGKRSETGPTV
ncbi:hypothetical protein Y032_0287g1445 [Ancylostoma ceylanicum]|uniref:Uncharacterized protein n=1 Tax=Ancylostoma ceylanicum TaxID=53326 RepID=A0A016S5P4_9BILA|nr:hypothetical protein Y032_0287g1445 [Ancylostoma ceylanicum]